MKAGPKRAALAFIFVTVVLDVLALGVVIPVPPRLVEGFAVYGLAPTARVFWAGIPVFALMGLFGPSLFAMVFANVVGPRADLDLPGAPFLLASSLLAAGVLIAWRVAKP